MARTRAKAPKKKPTAKVTPKAPSPPATAPPRQELAVDRSLQEMQADAAVAAAKQRVASFLERTIRLPWMRQRLWSFETSVILGLKNLLAEAETDEAQNRSSESYSAHYLTLYGLFTTLQRIFFWKAVESKLADRAELLRRAPLEEDLKQVLQELDVFHAGAISDKNQADFRRMLTQKDQGAADARKRIQEQARAYDLLNPFGNMPKA